MKPYWANDGGEWKMLVFAENATEAKKLAFNNMPMTGIEYIWVRVWRADDKWMAFYNPDEPVKDSYGGFYETWEQYWEMECEGVV